MKKNKMEQEEIKEATPVVEETQEVVESISETVEVIDAGKRAVNEAPIEEVKELVKECVEALNSTFEKVEPVFVVSEFAKQLQLGIKYFTGIYGETRDSQAAEIAKSCGTILAKILSRA